MNDLHAVFQCAYCGETNDAPVDGGGAAHQELVEDCRVCCRPNVLSLDLDLASGEVSVQAWRES